MAANSFMFTLLYQTKSLYWTKWGLHCTFWINKVAELSHSKLSYVFFSVFQPAHQAFSSQLKEMNPVCSVPSTAVPPVKAPLTAFAATVTIAPTQILSRCLAQVRNVLWLFHVNSNLEHAQTYEYVPTKPLISNMGFLAHTHFTPASRRALGSKDSGSLC